MNILLSSVGRRSYLVHYFRQALDEGGKVICTNCHPDTPGMVVADESCVVPASYEPGFLDALLDVCREFRPRLLFSLHDVEIPYIARAQERLLEVGTIPVVPGHELAQMCLDKFASYQFLQEHGVPAGRTFLHVEEAVAAVERGEITWPVVVKPRFGFGSFGISLAYDGRELAGKYDGLVRETRQHGYLRHLCRTDDLAIVQEMLDGPEYGLDIISDLESRFRTCLIERKLRMRSGETDAAEIVEDPRLFEMGRRIAELVPTPGVLDADVIVRDGTPYLLEVNPRFGGHYPFAHLAGANVPAAMVAWAEGREPDPAWLQARVGAGAFKDITLVSYQCPRSTESRMGRSSAGHAQEEHREPGAGPDFESGIAPVSNPARKILVLGGSHFQLPVIAYARSAGYCVITCDDQPDNPGNTRAHECHNISPTDREGVLALARRLEVDAVLAYTCGPGAPTAAYVAHELGLPTNPYESVRILAHRDLYRTFLREHGFASPKTWGVASGAHTSRETDGLDFPVSVVRGGAQMGGAAFVYEGRLVSMCLGDPLVDPRGNRHVPAGMLFPSRISSDQCARIAAELQRLLDLLDYSFGGLSIEIALDTEGRPYLMEVAPRAGDDFLPELMRYCGDADIARYSVESALGHELPGLPDTALVGRCQGFFACRAIRSRTAGVLRSIWLDGCLQPHILEFHQLRGVGEPIESDNSSEGTIGILLLRFATRHGMEAMIRHMANHVKIDLGAGSEPPEGTPHGCRAERATT